MLDQLLGDWFVDWEQLDTWQILVRNVVLRRDMGKFPAGTRALEVWVDFRHGRMSITTNIIDREWFDLALIATPAAS